MIKFYLNCFDIQPFQGCRLIRFTFRGLPPTVIQIKPFQGFVMYKSKGLESE